MKATLHNMYFVQYIFRATKQAQQTYLKIRKNTILLNIYLPQPVLVRGKYTFSSFSDFQTLAP